LVPQREEGRRWKAKYDYGEKNFAKAITMLKKKKNVGIP